MLLSPFFLQNFIQRSGLLDTIRKAQINSNHPKTTEYGDIFFAFRNQIFSYSAWIERNSDSSEAVQNHPITPSAPYTPDEKYETTLKM